MAGINPWELPNKVNMYSVKAPVQAQVFGKWMTIETLDFTQEIHICVSDGKGAEYQTIPMHVWADDKFDALPLIFEMAKRLDRPEDKSMPAFTKKHYEAVAVVLRNSAAQFNTMDGDTADLQLGASVVVSNLIKLFSDDNPRFNKQAFIDAIRSSK